MPPRKKANKANDKPKYVRQTRQRSKLPGAPQLMQGLAQNGQPLDDLGPDPENIPYTEVVQRIHQLLPTDSSDSQRTSKPATKTPPRTVAVTRSVRRSTPRHHNVASIAQAISSPQSSSATTTGPSLSFSRRPQILVNSTTGREHTTPNVRAVPNRTIQAQTNPAETSAPRLISSRRELPTSRPASQRNTANDIANSGGQGRINQFTGRPNPRTTSLGGQGMFTQLTGRPNLRTASSVRPGRINQFTNRPNPRTANLACQGMVNQPTTVSNPTPRSAASIRTNGNTLRTTHEVIGPNGERLRIDPWTFLFVRDDNATHGSITNQNQARQAQVAPTTLNNAVAGSSNNNNNRAVNSQSSTTKKRPNNNNTNTHGGSQRQRKRRRVSGSDELVATTSFRNPSVDLEQRRDSDELGLPMLFRSYDKDQSKN